MGTTTPPPLPPQGSQKDNNTNLPAPPPKRVPENDPTRPAPLSPKSAPTSPQENAIDIDYDVVKPRKSNFLWLIPTVICLLLIGCGIYAWYYVKEKEEKERRERQEEQEEQEARAKAIADSIAEAKRLQDQEEYERLNFSTPDLTFMSLKGHVQSVHYTIEKNYDWYDIYSMLLKDLTIDYDYDGNFVNLPANLNRDSKNPSVSYGSGNMVTDVIYNYDYSSDDYSLRWNDDYLSGINNEYYYVKYWEDHSGGTMSSPETIRWNMKDDDGNHAEITFNISYTDCDDYGNWRTAKVTASGSHTLISQEYNYYYEVYERSWETENLNYNYTIKRYINYYDKLSNQNKSETQK